VFEALDQKFHLDCFVCTVGEHKIGEGVNFHLHNEKIYCPVHFEELFLQKCAGCGGTIKGQYVKVLDSHYHPNCWKCADCQVVISSDNCGQSGGKFYCRNCVTKKGGASGGAGGSTSRPTPTPSVAKDTKVSGGGAYGGGGRSTSASVAPPAAGAGPGTAFYTYDALKDGKSVPAGVDPENRELYLADDVFLKMFKMDKATFSKLPGWKKKRLRQKVGLF